MKLSNLGNDSMDLLRRQDLNLRTSGYEVACSVSKRIKNEFLVLLRFYRVYYFGCISIGIIKFH